MSSLAIRFHRGGVFLPHLGLWLDPHEPKSGPERVFVSHAHSDHIGRHREIILSRPTSKLMHARLSGDWQEHALEFGRSVDFNGPETPFKITLLPAGHIFGSAMSLIEVGHESLLYTGDFKLRPGLSAERCEPRHADILIMETTYGRPVYQFPPTAAVMQGITRFCREALDNEETPVLLGYSLGKSQELLCGLAEAGLPIVLHGAVHKLTKIYEQFGQCFPPHERYESSSARGKVLISPPNAANAALLRSLGPTRVAVLTGWAVDPNCRFRYQAHAAFPLSDHADFPDLVEFVRRVQPQQVYTLHGFAADFAQSLRTLGYAAQALSEDEQLALPLVLTAVPPRTSSLKKRQIPPGPSAGADPGSRSGPAAAVPAVPGAEPRRLFTDFAETCLQIGSIGKKLEKSALLAGYLRAIDAASLHLVCSWFTGHPFPPTENKVLQLGWAIIRDSLCQVAGLDQNEFGQCYLRHSDLGETAFEVLLKASPTTPTLTLADVQKLFQELQAARGPLGKLPLLIRGLSQCTALEGKYLVKILTGDLRIGLKEGLVEEGIAQAFAEPLADVKNTNLILGNIGETAALAKARQLQTASLVPLRPLKYMLASPEETALDIWQRVLHWSAASEAKEIRETPLLPGAPSPPPAVWIEDKYDGIRCQMHKVGARVALYSRDLKEITTTFLDVADLARALPHDFVADGELVAMRGDEVLPFSELQRRLGRREGDLFLGQQIPVQYLAFDLLWADQGNWLQQPLQARRAKLEEIFRGSPLRLAQITRVHAEEEIERAFTEARQRGNEGLMIKDPASPYTPGRRGLSWLKLKKAYATLDCVVVGAEYGHGKRKGVLSDYTFAVRDEETASLKIIGKAYTGLTDVEIAQLTGHFLKQAVRQQGRYFEVVPDTVLEIAFDAIQASARHNSGLALRFPRIARIRTDKSLREIDTLQAARKLVRS